jgi:hypothetical protein
MLERSFDRSYGHLSKSRSSKLLLENLHISYQVRIGLLQLLFLVGISAILQQYFEIDF